MIELIQQRLDSYKASNPVAEEQATKEILQELALYSLWRAEFFSDRACKALLQKPTHRYRERNTLLQQ